MSDLLKYKATERYSFGWTDPSVVFSGTHTVLQRSYEHEGVMWQVMEFAGREHSKSWWRIDGTGPSLTRTMANTEDVPAAVLLMDRLET